MLPAEWVRCVCSGPQYGLNLLQRRLFIGWPASLVHGGITISVGSGVGSVVFSAFRHLEQGQLEKGSERKQITDELRNFKLERTWLLE